ncbi:MULTISPECIES: MFS transporter [unclassified Herbaspirillum]|uniref:MFS transporter n=1 Tax=unclassified Herbaspirillum TaxID=2624150 RepID=UPI000C09B57C|nr:MULTISPECIES: MFS transporter [unclassified Herbaspirillum]MAF06063.1 MFS transporter [Herbaspirillum sp.]MBO16784.1 MFS transporter [Herbaspirillum sp.]|tara:strand:+ start:2259 stop:3629 length:1371 start_codon:yes stop_codon:yes gene_type:complete
MAVTSASSSTSPDHDGLPPRQRLLAIATVVLGLSIAVLDGSIANLALPVMATDLKASDADAIWVINSYQIAMAVCLLPLASLGEVIGYRRVYLGGLFLFTLASLACAASGDMLQLSLARVLQGLGAAGILSVNTALIRFIYPARQLGRAIGYNALVAGTGNALGPTVAGVILHLGSWHWLFLINIPLGLAALAVGSRALPFNPLSARRFDRQSALLCMAFIGLLLYTIDAIGHLQGGWVVAGCALLTAISLALLLKLQSPSAPMLPLDLLRIPLFALSIGTSFCSFAAQMAVFVMLPFMLQNHLGMGAARAGMLLTAWPVAVALTGVVAGKLSDRVAAGLLGGIGLAVMCLGLLALLAVDRSTPDGLMLSMFAVCGIGFGLFQSPNNRTMISAAPRERTGGASGMLGTARLTGQTVGASVVAMLMGFSGSPYALVLCFAAALAGAASLVSLSRLRY